MEYNIVRAKELIAERESIDIATARATIVRFDAIDNELAELFSASTPAAALTTTRKPQACSKCGKTGHTARNCPKQTELPIPTP